MINQRNVFLRASRTCNGRIGAAPVIRTVACNVKERTQGALLALYKKDAVRDDRRLDVTKVEDLTQVLRSKTKNLKGPRAPEGETFLVLKKSVRCRIAYNGKAVTIEQVGKGSSLVDTKGHFWDPWDLANKDDLGRIIDNLP